MAMSQATLKSELVNMVLYSEESAAVAAWAAAWSAYFSDAESNSIPINPSGLPAAESAMAAALLGMSGSGAGAGVLQSAIQSWWNVLIASPLQYWPGCTLITPPPGLGGISSALQPVFDANTSGSVTEEQAYDAISAVFHPANLGGKATFFGITEKPIL